MVTTESGDVTKQGFCKILWRKLRLREGLLLCVGGSGVGLGAYSRLGAYSNKYGIQLERRALLALYWTAGTDLVVLTFQLLLDCNFFFFLVFFLLFFLCHFLLYFLDLFFDSLPSLTHLPPPPPRPLCSRQEGTTILFCSRSFIRLFRVLGLRKIVVWNCTDWRFGVMETLAVIMNCRWQVKRLKVYSFNSVWKENIVFSARKKNNNKNRETK